MHRAHPDHREAVVVVELERLPRLAPVAVPLRVAGGVERLPRDPVAHDVVRVRVAAGRVVGGHDVRPEPAHELHERGRGHLERLRREAPVGQRRQRVTLGQTGVDEPEPVVLDPERGGRRGHLVAAHLAHDLEPRLERRVVRVEQVAPLATGARDHEHLRTLGGVPRGGRRALARLVVGVRVHRHESTPSCAHHSSLPGRRLGVAARRGTMVSHRRGPPHRTR